MYGGGTIWGKSPARAWSRPAHPFAGGLGTPTYLAGTNNTWSGGYTFTPYNGAPSRSTPTARSAGRPDRRRHVRGTLNGNNNLAATAKAYAVANGTINFTSSAPVVGNIQGAGNIILGTSGSATNLSIGGDNSNSTFYGGISQVSGGTGSLTKQGAGTLTLTGPNTYTGPTTINAGHFVVNGSLIGPVMVDSGGTLDGTGTLGSVTVYAGGHLRRRPQQRQRSSPATWTLRMATSTLSVRAVPLPACRSRAT